MSTILIPDSFSIRIPAVFLVCLFSFKIFYHVQQIFIREPTFDSPFKKSSATPSDAAASAAAAANAENPNQPEIPSEQGESLTPTGPPPPTPSASTDTSTELLSSMVSLVSHPPQHLAGAHATLVHSSPEDMEFNRIKTTYANMNGDFAPEALASSMLLSTPALETSSILFSSSASINSPDFEVVDGTTIFHDAQPPSTADNKSSKVAVEDSVTPSLTAKILATQKPEVLVGVKTKELQQPPEAQSIQPSSSLEYQQSASQVESEVNSIPEVEKTYPQSFNQAPSTPPPSNSQAPSAAHPIIDAGQPESQPKTETVNLNSQAEEQLITKSENIIVEIKGLEPLDKAEIGDGNQNVMEELVADQVEQVFEDKDAQPEKEVNDRETQTDDIGNEEHNTQTEIQSEEHNNKDDTKTEIQSEKHNDKDDTKTETPSDDIDNEHNMQPETQSEEHKKKDNTEIEIQSEDSARKYNIQTETQSEAIEKTESIATEPQTEEIEKKESTKTDELSEESIKTEEEIEAERIEAERIRLINEERRRIIREALQDHREKEELVPKENDEIVPRENEIPTEELVPKENEVPKETESSDAEIPNEQISSDEKIVHELDLEFNKKSEPVPETLKADLPTEPEVATEKPVLDQSEHPSTELNAQTDTTTTTTAPDKPTEEIASTPEEPPATESPGFFGNFFGGSEETINPPATKAPPTYFEQTIPDIPSASEVPLPAFEQAPHFNADSDIKFYEPGDVPENFATTLGFEEAPAAAAPTTPESVAQSTDNVDLGQETAAGKTGET